MCKVSVWSTGAALAGLFVSALAVAGTPQNMPAQPAGTTGSNTAEPYQSSATEGQYRRLLDEVKLAQERVKLAELDARLAKIEQDAQVSSQSESQEPVLQPGLTTKVVSVEGRRGGGAVATLLLPSGGLIEVSVGKVVQGVGRVLSMGASGVSVMWHGHVKTLPFVTPTGNSSGGGAGYGDSNGMPPMPGNEEIPISRLMPTHMPSGGEPPNSEQRPRGQR